MGFVRACGDKISINITYHQSVHTTVHYLNLIVAFKGSMPIHITAMQIYACSAVHTPFIYLNTYILNELLTLIYILLYHSMISYVIFLPSPNNRSQRPSGVVEIQLYTSFSLGARLAWVVKAKPRPLHPRERDRIPIVQEARQVPGPVWTGVEYLAPNRDSFPGPFSSQRVAIPTELSRARVKCQQQYKVS